MSGVWFPSLALAVWLCCLSVGPVHGGKVLVVPMDGSHWLSMKLLVVELSNRGHEVVVLVPEYSLLIGGSKNYKTEIYHVSQTKAEVDAKFAQLVDGLFIKPPEFTDVFVGVERLVNFTSLEIKGCETLLDNQSLMSRLKERGFDVVLTDPFLPCGSILAHILSIPVVYFMRGLPCELDIKANKCPSPLSYVPVFFSGNTDIMTFPQRVKNTLMYMFETHLCSLMYFKFDEVVSKYLGDNMTYKDLLSLGDVWLIRSDSALEWPKPLLPNMFYIGGINCAKKGPLPADLEEFVDGSGDEGFIVFSLGSLVSHMPMEKTIQFLDAFQQIPQRVVWRHTGVIPKDVPKNVRIMKWLPQNDLLAHPKAKAFITHGGTHSIYEGICNAVPMLMFPLFGDQPENVFRMVNRGVAESLAIHDVTTESVLTALNKIIHDKSYKEKMAALSQIHLDRPVQPLDLAAFWTEFVMRHKGAAHLRVAAHDLNWIQYHCLDVIGFFVIVLLTVLWTTFKCCSFCARKCCRKGTPKRKQQ